MAEMTNSAPVPTVVVATRHTVRIPTRLAGLLLALLILVPAGSSFLAGRGSATPPQVVVYQPPPIAQPQPGPGRLYSAPNTAAPAPGAALPLSDLTRYPALGPQFGVAPGPIEELKKLIESLHPDNLIPNIIVAVAKAITGINPENNQPAEGRPDLASQIGAWLLQTPDFASPRFAATAPIRDFIDALRGAGWALLLVTAAAAAIRFKLGLDPEPNSTVVRLLVCAVFLGFYHELFSWATGVSNQITSGIFSIEASGWGALGRFAIPGFMPLQSILMLASFFVLLVVGFVRVLSLVLLLVVYVVGPLIVPLRMIPEWDFFSQWWQTGLRALVWPILWAVEAKLILVVTATAWAGGIAGVLFAPLAQIALLYAMYKTPSWVSVAGHAGAPKILRTITNVQTAGRIAYYTATAAGTGGVGAALQAALTGIQHARGASKPTKTGEA